MTSTPHAVQADWKLTETRRLLTFAGWGTLSLAVGGVAVALLLGVSGAWWMVAGTSAVALLVAALLPSPVPADMLTDRRSHVDGREHRG